MLVGSTTSHFAQQGDDMHNDEPAMLGNDSDELEVDGDGGQDKQVVEECDAGLKSLSSITLAAPPGKEYLLDL